MTSNFKFLAFVHNVSLLSVLLCSCFGHFWHESEKKKINQKKPHVDLRGAGKNLPYKRVLAYAIGPSASNPYSVHVHPVTFVGISGEINYVHHKEEVFKQFKGTMG